MNKLSVEKILLGVLIVPALGFLVLLLGLLLHGIPEIWRDFGLSGLVQLVGFALFLLLCGFFLIKTLLRKPTTGAFVKYLGEVLPFEWTKTVMTGFVVYWVVWILVVCVAIWKLYYWMQGDRTLQALVVMASLIVAAVIVKLPVVVIRTWRWFTSKL